jgi:hypothetical protein
MGEGWGGGEAQWNALFSIFLWRFWVSEELLIFSASRKRNSIDFMGA